MNYYYILVPTGSDLVNFVGEMAGIASLMMKEKED